MKSILILGMLLIGSLGIASAGEFVKRPLWTNEDGEQVETWVFQAGPTSHSRSSRINRYDYGYGYPYGYSYYRSPIVIYPRRSHTHRVTPVKPVKPVTPVKVPVVKPIVIR